jgi:hypothetical protein
VVSRLKLAAIGGLLALETLVAAACGGRPEATPAQVAAETPTPPAAEAAYITVEMENAKLSIVDVFMTLSDGSRKYFRLGRSDGNNLLHYKLPQDKTFEELNILNRACLGAERQKLTVSMSSNAIVGITSDVQGSYFQTIRYLASQPDLPERLDSKVTALSNLNLENCE